MKTRRQTRITADAPRLRLIPIIGFLSLIASVPLTYSQQVVAPLPGSSPASSASPSDSNGGAATGSLIGPAKAVGFAPGLQWGPFTLHPHLVYRILYGDGIQASPGHPVTTAISSLAPGLLTQWGTHWSLDYTPTWNYYSSKAFRDTVDHAAKLSGETTYEDWILGVSQTYVVTTRPLIETGRQTREEDYATHFSGNYQFATQLMLETGLTYNVRIAEGFSDTKDWSAREFLHLQLSPRLTTGIGTEFGYTTVSNGADMSYVQLLGRAVWHPVDQLGLQLEGGLEDRTIRQRGASDLVSPTLGASFQYRPVQTTTISINADRSISPSYFGGQVVENTRFAVAAEQRLLGAFNLSASVGYQESSFRGTAPGISAGRKDTNMTFSGGVQTTLLRKITVALTYQGSHNTSNQDGFGFSSNQLGLQVDYRY